MQILHWLFKSTHDQQEPPTDNNHHTNGKEAKSSDLILYKNRRRVELLSSKYLKKPFACLCRNDVAEASFYTNLNLRRVTTTQQQQQQRQQEDWRYSMDDNNNNNNNQTPTGQIVVDSAHVGNKVLLITDSTTLSFSNNTINGCDDNNNNNKTKTMSRIKELLRWAAATKSDKRNKFIARKVLQFRNRNTVKSVAADGDLNSSIESPKISFKWETESCSAWSTVSLRSNPIHDMNHSRKGNWITTDTEFVVLEL